MWVSNLELKNIRCFINQSFAFSKNINVLVGRNNSGKSTIVKSLAACQYSHLLRLSDKRKNASSGTITITFDEVADYLGGISPTKHVRNLSNNTGAFDRAVAQIQELSQVDPENFIQPYLAHRKVPNFNEDTRESASTRVDITLQNLTARLATVSNSAHPSYNLYKDACDEILGFHVTNIPSPNGQEPGVFTSTGEKIPLTAMGDGVAMIVGFLVSLATAENKLFLIEEPENDLHPAALKKLLNLIIKSSEKNQFIVSTHSNIVLRTLGQFRQTKIFKLTGKFEDRTFESVGHEVTNIEERLDILNDLGYDFYDDESYNSWVIFEESSAERIVREFLIPWFTPSLSGKVRTFSARGVTEVRKKFDDFNDLFSFLNLEPKYKNRAWVFVDSGEVEAGILSQLKDSYVTRNGWSSDRFIQFNEHNFERYYPLRFKPEVDEIEQCNDQQVKRRLKKVLLDNVLSWIKDNPDIAKQEFEISSSEVIGYLINVRDVLDR